MINPDSIQRKRDDFPETVVSIFHHILFNKIVAFLNAKEIGESNDVDGTWTVYEAEYKGIRIGLVKARLGAAACVGLFEEIIAIATVTILREFVRTYSSSVPTVSAVVAEVGVAKIEMDTTITRSTAIIFFISILLFNSKTKGRVLYYLQPPYITDIDDIDQQRS